MALLSDRSERGLDLIPATVVVQDAPHGFRDECAPLPAPDSAVQLGDERIIEGYVHSHGHTLAHSGRTGKRPLVARWTRGRYSNLPSSRLLALFLR